MQLRIFIILYTKSTRAGSPGRGGCPALALAAAPAQGTRSRHREPPPSRQALVPSGPGDFCTAPRCFNEEQPLSPHFSFSPEKTSPGPPCLTPGVPAQGAAFGRGCGRKGAAGPTSSDLHTAPFRPLPRPARPSPRSESRAREQIRLLSRPMAAIAEINV